MLYIPKLFITDSLGKINWYEARLSVYFMIYISTKLMQIGKNNTLEVIANAYNLARF